MSFQIADAYVDVHVDASRVGSQAASDIGGQGGLFSGMGKIAGGIIGAGLITGAAKIVKTGLSAVFATGLDEYKDADAANSQFAAGIKSTGNAAGLTVAHMNDLASSIQTYSGQTDDSIAQSENLLQTFTNIKNTSVAPIFDEATRATADMAARMGGDASTYAIQLGKALNDPINGVSALTRIGVTFDAQQKNQIKTMQEAGNTAGAQAVIMKELNKEFGGSAEAAGKSFPGTIARIKRGWEDLTQGIVGGLMPAITPALGLAATLIEKISGPVGTLASEVGTKLTPVFTALGTRLQGLDLSKLNFSALAAGFSSVSEASPLMVALKSLAPLFPIIGSTLMTLAPLIGQLAAAFSGALSQAIQALVPSITSLLPVIVQIATQFGGTLLQAITALTPVITLVAQALASMIQFLTPFAPVIAAIVIAFYAWTAAQWLLNLAMDANPIGLIVLAIVGLIAIIVILVTHWSTVTSFLKTVWGGFVNWLMAGLRGLGAFWSSVWSSISSFVSNVWNTIVSFVRVTFAGIVAFIRAYLSIVTSIWSGTWNAVRTVVVTIWNGIKTAISSAIGSVVSTVTSLKSKVLGAVSGAATWLVSTGANIVRGIISGIESNIGEVASRITSGIKGAIGAVKSFLGIHSPSRLMRDEVGVQIPAGAELGVKDGMPSLNRTVRNMVQPVPFTSPKTGMYAAAPGSSQFGQTATPGGPGWGKKVELHVHGDINQPVDVDMVLSKMQFAAEGF